MAGPDPFLLPPRSIISFSGGRTSGYLLRRVLDAFGGSLPDDRVVIFCNTGKEREETLGFVEDCSRTWRVPVVWLEYRHEFDLPVRRSKAGKPVALHKDAHRFAIVDHTMASRNGEPFDQLIRGKTAFRAEKGDPPVLPHVKGRYCTADLKIRTTGRYVATTLRWREWTCAVGIRADEPGRLASLTGCDFVEDTACRGERPVCPLAEAGVSEPDVMSFWQSQRGGLPLDDWLSMPPADRPGWDLPLRQHEGNCDACFLKKRWKVEDVFRRRPELADWWAAAEASTGDTFRNDRPTYAELKVISQRREPSLFDGDEELEFSCTCTD